MKYKPTYRTITSVTFIAQADRTDGDQHQSGDRLEITYEECDHIGQGNPSMSYTIGSKVVCFQCSRAAGEAEA